MNSMKNCKECSFTKRNIFILINRKFNSIITLVKYLSYNVLSLCITESFNTKVQYQFFDYKITFMKSQHTQYNSNSIYFAEKPGFIAFFLLIHNYNPDSDLVGQIQLIFI